MEHGGRAVDPLTTIRTVAETGSTNADMLALARRGLSEGVWLHAERQTAGRGREGRAWISPVGNLYASTLVRLRPGDPAATGLSLVTGVALAEVIGSLISASRSIMPRFDNGDLDDPWPASRRSTADLGVTLKWPNDLLIRRAKVAGILLERFEDAVVVGLGVNVASCPDIPDRAVTSLAREGVTLEPIPLLGAIAAAFAGLLALWRRDGLEPIRRGWLAVAHPLGTPLTARLPDGTAFVGAFDGLATDGALLLRLADGSRRVIHAGDVFAL